MLDPESSAELKEERVANTRETVSSSHNREKAKQAGREDHSVLHVISAADSRKPKSAQELVDGNAVPIGELDTSRRKRKPLHNKVFAYLYICKKNASLLIGSFLLGFNLTLCDLWLVVHNALVGSLAKYFHQKHLCFVYCIAGIG